MVMTEDLIIGNELWEYMRRVTLREPDLLRGARRCDDNFITFAHAHQVPPAVANNGGPWTTWLALGGRGAGKTRLGAEFVRALAFGIAPYADAPHGFNRSGWDGYRPEADATSWARSVEFFKQHLGETSSTKTAAVA